MIYLRDSSYTTAFALFDALWEAGITACFVTVGSDHPSIIEAIIKGKRERPETWPRFITCPSEITAISMTDGYARVSGRPPAVIVHVDVGTQALGQGLHNASVGRAPVFIFAGMCPYTEAGEKIGSRTEYMHWLQEAPDQKATARQYCRYTGEIRSGLNAKQTVARALQFASSAPKGPVYVTSARETLAEIIEKPYSLDQEYWKPIGPGALPTEGVEERPLVITGYSGRDKRCPDHLVALADLIPGLRVHDTGGSDLCFPFSHPASQGFRLSTDNCTQNADMILLLECDVPWIPSKNPPAHNTRIYHLDIDPLNQQIPVSFFPAHGRWRADCYTALNQLVSYITKSPFGKALQHVSYQERKTTLVEAPKERLDEIATRCRLDDEESLDASNIGYLLKRTLPESTVFVIEAVTYAHWIGCGATGIGWSNGAALGVKMALDDAVPTTGRPQPSFVCQVVGDGSFMCAAPSSSLWVASKYNIPVLTIVLNNGGFNAPRKSTQIVYPEGLNKGATGDEMNISFEPSPNYAALAEAASGSSASRGGIQIEGQWMLGVQVNAVGSLKTELGKASKRILEAGKGMLIEALIP
ncbi:thiamine pyrophosphate enzyme [Cucurbitaria berberidis CBS 394.84]|uniref:Thiamine pyrophosphate enzyme n=1 Tax=Cucurbitaria berberidis CBS 394.84 TaxID=1168544 RepID=A0A9P4GU89_9PLEO|nr:thiamine pyrophosphate enzyme [Cucurbitaria berberidis CBS 394.84]KAF1851626.1 thiamine pyrophosphate enzyme [Cucurbitaria berberidis CBS 394.84]